MACKAKEREEKYGQEDCGGGVVLAPDIAVLVVEVVVIS